MTKKEKIELNLKKIECFLSALTLLLALWVFYDGANVIREQYKSTYWEHQLKIYSNILESAGKISHLNVESSTFNNALNAYKSIFYGEANFIHSSNVKDKITKIKEKIDQIEFLLQSDKIIDAKRIQKEISILTINLSKLCGQSLLNGWNIETE